MKQDKVKFFLQGLVFGVTIGIGICFIAYYLYEIKTGDRVF